MPTGVEDRDADVWEPMLAIADGVGGEWSTRARDAAITLVGAARDAEPSLRIRLLADLKAIFDTATLGALQTSVVLQRLTDIPESPWGDLKGKPINDRRLASMLRQFGVKSRDIFVGGKGLKGYHREDLHDVWRRYLPPNPPEKRDERDERDTPPENGHFTQENVAGVEQNKRDEPPSERDEIADRERDEPSERDGNSSMRSEGIADIADIADLRGNGGAVPYDAVLEERRAQGVTEGIPDFLQVANRKLPFDPDRRPALGPEGDSLDDLR
jgi:Protein of unknown function (DUF3631)